MSLSPEALDRLLAVARPLASDPHPPLQFLGKYELVRQLGRGAMGAVYEASYTMAGRRLSVALKLLADGGFASPALRERFWGEALAATRLSHPRIVRILEVNSAFLVMQLIDGPSLAGARLTEPEACALIAEVARAVGAAHAQGVIHRDLKPANLLRSRADGAVYVTDFGLASCGRSDSDVVGTPGFMPPEQALGAPAAPTADVYALGATLAALLASPASDGLAALLARCQAPEPAERYPSMAALAAALDALHPIRQRSRMPGQSGSCPV